MFATEATSNKLEANARFGTPFFTRGINNFVSSIQLQLIVSFLFYLC